MSGRKPCILFPVNFTDDSAIRAVFSWQTRNGLAPKFATLPIHHYQLDQCASIDEITRRIALVYHSANTPAEVRVRNGRVQFRSVAIGGSWYDAGSVWEIVSAAQKAEHQRANGGGEVWTPRLPGACAVCGEAEATDVRGWVQPDGRLQHHHGIYGPNSANPHKFEFRPAEVRK
jgi:hypothetical protein